MSVAPDRPPRRRTLRRNLIVLAAGLAVLVLGLTALGVGSVTGALDVALHPPLNPAPWDDGDRIRPVRSSDAKVRSVLRAQQYETAWRTLVTTPDQQQVQREYTFDPDQRRGKPSSIHRLPSYLAGISVYANDYSATTGGSYEIDVAEYEDPDDAAAMLRGYHARRSMRQVSAPAIEGADTVSVRRGRSLSLPCRPEQGRPIALAVDAVVDGTVAVSILDGCASTADGSAPTEALLAIAEQAVQAIDTVRAQPVPARWMPGTARVPIISSGSWHQSQLQVADRADGLDVDPLLDEPFAGSGVDTVYYARNTVYAYPSHAAAHAVLGRLPGMTDDDRRYRESPHPVDRGESDERLCAEGLHWQQGTTCWSRVGRFVVVQAYGENSAVAGSLDESQVTALHGVR
jgi:hypothetical protein